MIDLTKQKLFFISDAHFCHRNVIRFDHRPFTSVEEMNETIIANWNNTVDKDDLVYYLGDFGFAGITKLKSIAHRLNGVIHCIMGNHDSYKDMVKLDRFATIEHYQTIRIADEAADRGAQMICLSHYPIHLWDRAHFGSWNLFGHCHHSLDDDQHIKTYKMLDVGVNGAGYNYSPISYEYVKQRMVSRIAPAHHDLG